MTSKTAQNIRVNVYAAGDDAHYRGSRQASLEPLPVDARMQSAGERLEPLIVRPLNLLDAPDVDALILEIQATVRGGNLIEIVIDDLSHSLGGSDPMDPAVARRLTAALRRLRKPFVNCSTVLLVDRRDVDAAPGSIIYNHRLTWDQGTNTWRYVSRPSRARKPAGSGDEVAEDVPTPYT